jgi:hypothetical protein
MPFCVPYETHIVGRMCSVIMLKQVVYTVTTVF